MNDTNILDIPEQYEAIQQKSAEIGFTMPSDLLVGSLLKSLVSAKPKGLFLELGTGVGLSLAWMIEGMDQESKIVSIDNDPKLSDLAHTYFWNDDRVH